MFRQLIRHPVYIFKFAIYVLFICFAVIFYFSGILPDLDKSVKNMYAVIILLYGSYRMVRTYQDFKAELRNENEE